MKIKSRQCKPKTIPRLMSYKPKDILLISDFFDVIVKCIDKFEEKHKCSVKYNIENLVIKKTK